MRRTLVLTLLAALLAAPHVGAWPGDPLTITLGASRVGDVLRYGSHWEEDGESHARTRLVRVESTGTVLDRHGTPRAVETYRIDHLDEQGELASAELCHALAGGTQAVRRDLLAGAWGWNDSWDGAYGVGHLSLGRFEMRYDQRVETLYHSGPCEGRQLPAGRTYAEGDRLAWHEVGLHFGEHAPEMSAPAEATEFHGRPALRFRFAMPLPPHAPAGSWSHVDVVLADGLPGIARVHVAADVGGHRASHVDELEGLLEGDGAPLAPYVGATLPDENPNARFVTLGRFELPDEGLGVAYPAREAIASLLADPRVGLKAWLDAHPDAVLTWAAYRKDYEAALGARSDGGWTFTWADGASTFTAASVRAYHDTPLGRVQRPPALEQWGGEGRDRPGPALAAPERSADAESLARLLAAADLPLERVTTLTFALLAAPDGASHLGLMASDETASGDGRRDARVVDLDATTGDVWIVWRTSSSSTTQTPLDPLAPPASFAAPQRLAALSALAGPGIGVGLGVGAATGLALLVVAVKFLLVPLFTRLVRARLLDNPVRARLYERVRAEPGIRQAELVDYLGVGEGTTRHHLAQLARHGYVVETGGDAGASYYAAGEVPPEVARRAAVLRSASAKRVYDAYAEAPGLSLREAAARLGMSAPSVHRQKRKLEKAGLLPAAPEATVQAP